MPTSQFTEPVQFFAALPLPGFPGYKFEVPKESGRKVALARAIFWQSKLESSALVWLRNWMVFPSCGHLPLVLRLREAMGCRQPLEQRPGGLVQANELDDALSLLIVSLQFFWDCFIADWNLRLICFASHDEYLLLMSADERFLEQITTVLQKEELCRRIG